MYSFSKTKKKPKNIVICKLLMCTNVFNRPYIIGPYLSDETETVFFLQVNNLKEFIRSSFFILLFYFIIYHYYSFRLYFIFICNLTIFFYFIRFIFIRFHSSAFYSIPWDFHTPFPRPTPFWGELYHSSFPVLTY